MKWIIIFFLISYSYSAKWKQCCNLDCSRPISLSRSRTMKYDNIPGHLKFAKHAVMKIIAKNVGGKEDLWEAEIYGRQGLVYSSDVSEYQHLCEQLTWVPLNAEYIPIVGDYEPNSNVDIPLTFSVESDVVQPEAEAVVENTFNGQREETVFVGQVDDNELAANNPKSVNEGMVSEQTPDQASDIPDEPHDNPVSASEYSPFTTTVHSSWSSDVPNIPSEPLLQTESFTPSLSTHLPHESLASVPSSSSSISFADTPVPSPFPDESFQFDSSPVTTFESNPFVSSSSEASLPEESPSHVSLPTQPPVVRENDQEHQHRLLDETASPQLSVPSPSFPADTNEPPLEKEPVDQLSPIEDVQKWRQEQLDRYSRESSIPAMTQSPAVPEPVQKWRQEQLERDNTAPTFTQEPDHTRAWQQQPTSTGSIDEEEEEDAGEEIDSVDSQTGNTFTEGEEHHMTEDQRVESISDSPPLSPSPDDEEANIEPSNGEDSTRPSDEEASDTRPFFEEDEEALSPVSVDDGGHEDPRLDTRINNHPPHDGEAHQHDEDYDSEDVDVHSFYQEESFQEDQDDNEDGDDEIAPGTTSVSETHTDPTDSMYSATSLTNLDFLTELPPGLTNTPPAEPRNLETLVSSSSTTESPSTVLTVPPPSIPSPHPEFPADQYGLPPNSHGDKNAASEGEQARRVDPQEHAHHPREHANHPQEHTNHPQEHTNHPQEHDRLTENMWDSPSHTQKNRDQEDMDNSEQPPTEDSKEVPPPQEKRYDPSHFRLPPHSFSFEEVGIGECPPCPHTHSHLHGITEHVANALPPWIGEWLLAQGPDVGLLGLVITFVTLLVSTCCLCCSARKKASRSVSSLKKEKVSKRQAEQQAEQLKLEKNQLQFEVQRLQTEVHSCREELESEKQGTWDLENIRQNLEDEKESLSQSLSLVQQKLLQNQDSVQQLEAELQQKASQLAAMAEEKVVTHQQLLQLDTQMKEAVQRNQELDAAKEQLEQDLFTCRQSLQQQCDSHSRLSGEYTVIQNHCQQLQEELSTAKQQGSVLQEMLTEKENEAETLQQCVHQLSDNLGKEEGETSVSKLQRVQAMLDTTKAQTQLRVVTEERDMLNRELQEQTAAVDQLQVEKQSLENKIHALVSDKELVSQQHQETQMKLKTLTEYFEQKELHLHKKLGAEELTRQHVETQEALASEKVNQVEQEREKERQELKELRKQMADIERSLMQQVVTNEKRAEEALSQLRRTEQELRASNKEVTSLRKRLTEVEEANRRPHSPPSYPLPRPHARYSPPSGPPRAEMLDTSHSPRRRLSPDLYPPYGPPPHLPRGVPPPGASLPAMPRHSPLHGPPPTGVSLHPPYSSLPRSSSPRSAANGPRASLLNSTHPPPHSAPPAHEEPPQHTSQSYDSTDEPATHQPADYTNKSRPPPPGMESGVPIRPRPMALPQSYYPPPTRGYREYSWVHPPRPGSRSEIEFRRDDSLDRDRPPIPGNPEYPPFPPGRGYPSNRYRPDRRRPPSGPPYSELARGPDYPHPSSQDYPRGRMPPSAVRPPLQRPGPVPPAQVLRKSPSRDSETNTA